MFAGLFSKEQAVSAWGGPDNILTALAPCSLDKPRDVWISDRQMLVQVATRTGSVSAEIYQHPESGVVVAFWGRLDNRPNLIAQLEAGSIASDDELIALAWLKWGEHCPEKLIGDFALAVVSPKAGVVFLARDVMGVKPLVYRADEHGVFFANSAAAFKALAIGTLTPSKSWAAKFLIYQSTSQFDTAYEEIKKLPPAHSLLMHGSDGLKIRRYHQFIDDAPRESTRNPGWLEAYKNIWQQSVECRLPTTGQVGCENSGGIDSGSITSEVARLLGNDIGRLNCFGFCREQLEPAAIMSVAMKFGIANNFISSRPYDYHYLPEVIDRSLAVNGYPFEIGVAEDHDQFYRVAARQKVGTLFSGFGGDEVVTSENWQAFQEFHDAREYLNLLRITPGNAMRKAIYLSKFLWQDKKSIGQERYDRKTFAERWAYTFFTAEAEEELKLRETFVSANEYINSSRNVNELAMQCINQPHVPVRLENGTLLAASHGIDYVWPMLDQRLIQQWLSTPTLWKIGDNLNLRYLHRSAIEGVCPAQIASKQSKDMGSVLIRQHFETKSNLRHFQQMLDISEEIPPLAHHIIDVKALRKVALNGMQQDARGYEVFSALLMLNWNLQALVSWLKCQSSK